MRPIRSWTVTVVGLGQIGGSIAAALTRGRLVERVRGIDTDATAVARALERKYVHEGGTAFTRPLLSADLLVLAAPVREVLRMVPEIAALAPYDTFLLDVCSTKVEVMKALGKHFKSDVPGHIRFVGGHPIAGRERAGIDAADPGLFQDTIFILTPPRRLTDRASALSLQADPLAPGGPSWRVVDWVRALGAEPIFMEAEDHDALLAITSHLPHCLAAALARCAGRDTRQASPLGRVIGGSFRDVTRVAASDVKMTLDILTTNRANVDKAIGEFVEELGKIRTALKEGDDRSLEALLRRARDIRMDLVPDAPQEE